MTYIGTIKTYRLSTTNGVTQEFRDLDEALDWALEWQGIHADYECEDGRVLLYESTEDMDADETGAAAMGAIEVIEEADELEVTEDDYYYARRPYCADRTCGATDCSNCYGWA